MNRRRFLRLLGLAPVAVAVAPVVALAGAASRPNPFELGTAIWMPGQTPVFDGGRYIWSIGAAEDWEEGIGLLPELEAANDEAVAT